METSASMREIERDKGKPERKSIFDFSLGFFLKQRKWKVGVFTKYS